MNSDEYVPYRFLGEGGGHSSGGHSSGGHDSSMYGHECTSDGSQTNAPLTPEQKSKRRKSWIAMSVIALLFCALIGIKMHSDLANKSNMPTYMPLR